MSGAGIDVLVVDDSAVVRQVLTAVLRRQKGIGQVSVAADPTAAMRVMNQRWPDVVVLDVEMPGMDGITFLKKIMGVRPTPVVICSTLTQAGAATSVAALSAGAVAVVAKPHSGLRDFLEADEADLVGAVRAAAAATPRRTFSALPAADQTVLPTWSALDRTGQPATAGAMAVTTERIVSVGASTGGAAALEVVVRGLVRTAPGVVVVQHMPERFTAAFAERLNQVCAVEVREAADGDRVLAGRVLIAPGGRHAVVRRDGAQYRVQILDGPPVNRHRPSVDVLFRSVADAAGANAMGVIMTGMGDDGARGLLAVRKAGGRTLGQDQATCVVYGMPGAARGFGAVQHEVPLPSIAGHVAGFGGGVAPGARPGASAVRMGGGQR